MLIGLPALQTPDLLRHLRAMGHGDTIAIVDANFPAEANARRIERLPGISATEALRAVLTLLPLDDFVPDPARAMAVVGDPEAVPPIVAEFQEILDRTADNPARITRIEREAFYAQARDAYLIVQTAETRLYGNVILTKGVIRPQ